MSSVHFLIGKTLGKYQVLEHIGHGGMSEVYKGQQAQLNRMVAIKVLHPFLADEEGFVVRFQREARIVATLRHPNIVQVFDFDYNEDLSLYYMVMEYIEGPTLKDQLSQGPLSTDETAQIGATIADALDYAHQRSMVHRDIKPANILFLNKTDPVLTDFGIARMLNLSGLTASGAMVGTPAYMAPEVGRGKAGSAASDIYSLSVVLYEVVTGALPFSAETPMGMVMEHLNTAPLPPSRVRASIPDTLESIILQGLSKEPEARFESAGAMAVALRGALDLTVDHTPTPPPAIISTSEARSNGIAQAPVTSDPTALEAAEPPNEAIVPEERLLKSWDGAQPAPPQPSKERSPDTPPAPSQRRAGLRPSPWLVGALLTLLIAGIGGMIYLWRGPWAAAQDDASFRPWGRLLAGDRATAPATEARLPAEFTDTPTTTPAATATPWIAEGLALATHTPTPTLVCTLRMRAEQVRIEPAGTVAPSTPLMALISLQNSGNCPWPTDSALVRTSDNDLGALSVFTVSNVLPGESIQLFIPMTAPDEFGSYLMTWEMHQGDGKSFGSRIPIEIVVEDRPTLTPTPTLELVSAPIIPITLTLDAPRLVSWRADPAKGLWSGLAQLQASGGSGHYRYYLGEISGSTEILNGELLFEWRYCRNAPLNLWVLSGGTHLNWRGEIPYPEPEVCE